MFNIFRWLKNKNDGLKSDEYYRKKYNIYPGQKRYIKESDDPFPPKKNTSSVIDIKDGWVRYYINAIFDDEREDIETYVAMYNGIYEDKQSE
jgi:hypothetical protein